MDTDNDRLTVVEKDLDRVAGHTTDLAKAVIDMKANHAKDLDDLHEKLSADFDEKLDAFKKEVLGTNVQPSEAVTALGDKVATLTGDTETKPNSIVGGYTFDTIEGGHGADSVKLGGEDSVGNGYGQNTVASDWVGKTYDDTVEGSAGNDTVTAHPVSGADNVG